MSICDAVMFPVQAVREKVQGRLAGARDLLRAARRRAVTGNAETRVRDYMAQVPQVKLVDKLSFTLGVLCIVTTEFLALRQPQYFTQFYSVLITALLVNRQADFTISPDSKRRVTIAGYLSTQRAENSFS